MFLRSLDRASWRLWSEEWARNWVGGLVWRRVGKWDYLGCTSEVVWLSLIILLSTCDIPAYLSQCVVEQTTLNYEVQPVIGMKTFGSRKACHCHEVIWKLVSRS